MSMTTTTVDTGSVLMGDNVHRQEVLKFAAGATRKAGLILARDTTDDTLVPYVAAGANGTGIPKAVLGYDVTRADAGNVPIQACVGGRVNRRRLIILADGDASNVDEPFCDLLRDFGLFPVDVQQLAELDNL